MEVYQKYESELFSGYVKTRVEGDLLLWKGAKIPYGVWRKALAFMKKSYDTFNAESVARLYYNSDKREWALAVKEQLVTHLHVDETGDSPEIEQLMLSGYDAFGTIHHHSNVSAGQSGGDHADESTSPGLHVTLGNMDSDTRYSHHTRLVFKQSQYSQILDCWVDLPEIYVPDSLPDTCAKIFREEAKSIMLFAAASEEELSSVPAEWMSRISKKSSPAVDNDVWTTGRYTSGVYSPYKLPGTTEASGYRKYMAQTAEDGKMKIENVANLLSDTEACAALDVFVKSMPLELRQQGMEGIFRIMNSIFLRSGIVLQDGTSLTDAQALFMMLCFLEHPGVNIAIPEGSKYTAIDRMQELVGSQSFYDVEDALLELMATAGFLTELAEQTTEAAAELLEIFSDVLVSDFEDILEQDSILGGV